MLRRVGGKGFDLPIRALDDIAPDLGRLTVEFGYGDVLARDVIPLPARQLCTVGALAAMGTAQPQLRYHIDGARNVGVEAGQVIEVLILAAVYAGFPAALNGITAARDVFTQRGETPAAASRRSPDDRHARGLDALERISGGTGAAVVDALDDVAPDLGRFIVEFSYGDVISRPGLDDWTTELVTIAMCTALGTAQPQLAVHIQAALNVGVTREEIVEVIQQMALYAGFPAALNGIAVARGVFATG